mgnify:CR=1 FL=1
MEQDLSICTKFLKMSYQNWMTILLGWYLHGLGTIQIPMFLCAIAAEMARVGMERQGNITTAMILVEIEDHIHTTEAYVSAIKMSEK